MRKGDLRVLARQFKCSCAGGGEKLHEELRIVSFVNIYPSVVKVTSRLFVVHKFSSRVAYKDRLLTHVGRYLKTIIITRCGLTAGVMPLQGYWRAGRDNAILTEPASSHANGLKTRRLPPAVPEPVEGSGARCVSPLLTLRSARFIIRELGSVDM